MVLRPQVDCISLYPRWCHFFATLTVFLPLHLKRQNFIPEANFDFGSLWPSWAHTVKKQFIILIAFLIPDAGHDSDGVLQEETPMIVIKTHCPSLPHVTLLHQARNNQQQCSNADRLNPVIRLHMCFLSLPECASLCNGCWGFQLLLRFKDVVPDLNGPDSLPEWSFSSPTVSALFRTSGVRKMQVY